MRITEAKITFGEIPFARGGFSTISGPNRTRKTYGFTLVKVFTDEDILGIASQDVNFPEWGIYLERLIEPLLLEKV